MLAVSFRECCHFRYFSRSETALSSQKSPIVGASYFFMMVLVSCKHYDKGESNR